MNECFQKICYRCCALAFAVSTVVGIIGVDHQSLVVEAVRVGRYFCSNWTQFDIRVFANNLMYHLGYITNSIEVFEAHSLVGYN